MEAAARPTNVDTLAVDWLESDNEGEAVAGPVQTRWRTEDGLQIPTPQPAEEILGRIDGKPSRRPKHTKEYEEWHNKLKSRHAEVVKCLAARTAMPDVAREPTEPGSFYEAVNGKYKKFWIPSIKDEHSSLMKNVTGTLVELPDGRAALDCMWVYKEKEGHGDVATRHKTRLVIKGCFQKKGSD